MHGKTMLLLMAGMASLFFAAPTSSPSSITTAPFAEFTPERGTFDNAAPIKTNKTTPIIALVAPDLHKAPHEQPDVVAGKCDYSYIPTLKSNATFLGRIYSSQGSLRFEDVKQGAVGDCGLGASVLALLGSNRWEPRLAGQYDLTTDEVNAYFDVEFANQDGTPYIAQIDASLPFTTNDPVHCWPYMGYQPTKDTDGAAVLYVPLLEKAWAKYLDSNPDLKTHNSPGYQGLEGTQPHYVLHALTGWNTTHAIRAGPGVDPAIKDYTYKAVTSYQPTVYASPTSDTVKTLGWYYDNSTSTAYLTYGTLTVTSPSHVLKYTRYADSSEHFMVGSHAYALTPADDLRATTEDGSWGQLTAVLRNPWGVNPSSATQNNGPQTFELTYDEIATIFTQIYTAIPPATEDPRNP